jgi:hypothetical protein
MHTAASAAPQSFIDPIVEIFPYPAGRHNFYKASNSSPFVQVDAQDVQPMFALAINNQGDSPVDRVPIVDDQNGASPAALFGDAPDNTSLIDGMDYVLEALAIRIMLKDVPMVVAELPGTKYVAAVPGALIDTVLSCAHAGEGFSGDS